MASKYLKKFPIPDGLPFVLHDFAKAVMMEQPTDVVKFAAAYFRSKADNQPFVWDEPTSRVPKPVGYPRVKGRKPEVATASEQDKTSSQSLRPKSTDKTAVSQTEIKPKQPPVPKGPASVQSIAAECAKEYLNEVLEQVCAHRRARV